MSPLAGKNSNMSQRLQSSELLDDICEALDRIEQYIGGMPFDVFSKDRKSVDAVDRGLDIIAEASNRLPADFKNSHSQI